VIDAILSGGESLPEELHELRNAVHAHSAAPPTPATTTNVATNDVPIRTQRQNIWNDQELDVSKLRIKDDDDV